MINIDFECANGHRFEGCFSDYRSFTGQKDNAMIRCPVCSSADIKRIYTGCSIHSRGGNEASKAGRTYSVLELLKEVNTFVKGNFEDTGDNFAEKAREIHYGIADARNIYGKTTPRELKELNDEGIEILPVPDIEQFYN